jgi:hypothetical protein
MYVIEGSRHRVNAFRTVKWKTLRTDDLKEAREYADKIFKATGVVVAITSDDPRQQQKGEYELGRIYYPEREGQ